MRALTNLPNLSCSFLMFLVFLSVSCLHAAMSGVFIPGPDWILWHEANTSWGQLWDLILVIIFSCCDNGGLTPSSLLTSRWTRGERRQNMTGDTVE